MAAFHCQQSTLVHHHHSTLRVIFRPNGVVSSKVPSCRCQVIPRSSDHSLVIQLMVDSIRGRKQEQIGLVSSTANTMLPA